MFERPHHRRIAQVLERLDCDALKEHRCYFGGGTAIALAHGEYRESVDVDFICDSVDGYRAMRSAVDGSSLRWALKAPLDLAREPRVDQYGIRAAFKVDGVAIKFEIVHEGRIQLDAPVEADRICGVWRLTDSDLAATKLMANADRWADSAVMSRDLIDLAMMTRTGTLPRSAVDKAERAYGTSIASAFMKAKALVRDNPTRLKACMKAMGMTVPERALRSAVDRLTFENAPAATARPRPPRRPRSA
ncbi:MAG: nucleotidyl transferase AbiEii/AbiGii toxin family protein [Rhizobacter sp.]